MACNLENLDNILPVRGSRINFSPELNQELLENFIEEVEDPRQAVIVIRALFNRYPDEALLERAIQRFFEVHKLPCSNSWKHELEHLLTAIRGGHLTEWEVVIYSKVVCYCPDSVDYFWGEKNPMPQSA